MNVLITFFRDLQDRYLVVFCFLIVLVLYIYVRTDAVLQLMINFGVAIIALAKRQPQNVGSTDSGDVLITETEKTKGR